MLLWPIELRRRARVTDDVAKLLDQRGNFEGSRVPTEEEQASMVRAGCGGRPGDVKCR